MKNNYLGALLILLSTLGFSVMPIFALYAYKGGITVSTVLLIRFFLASVLLGGYAFVKYGKLMVSKRDLLFLFILGGVCYTLQSTFYFSSVKFISPSLAALILYTYPIMVAILSILIDKEKLNLKTVAAMLLSFIGIAVFLGASPAGIDMRGIMLALGAAFVYSCYIIVGNRVVKQLPSIIVTVYVMAFASVGLLILGMASGDLSFAFAASVWLPILGLVLLSSILAILTFFKGLEFLGPTKSSILSMLEPVFTATFSMILFHDRLGILQIAGGITVLAGAMLVVLSKQKVQKADNPVEQE